MSCTMQEGADLAPEEGELPAQPPRDAHRTERRLVPGCPLLAAMLMVVLAACDDDAGPPSFDVTSQAFGDEQTIPVRHTCDGQDVSPPLSFEGVPEKAVSLAVVMDEPEAAGGRFTHWLLWGIPAGSGLLGEGVEKTEGPGGGLYQGKNDAESIGYSGPCPEEEDSEEHRYVVRVFALDVVPAVPAGAERSVLMKAMEGHIVGKGTLVGYYARED
jgi:Raf kinase inhibitor-like YbhB/YbcL family protein